MPYTEIRFPLPVAKLERKTMPKTHTPGPWSIGPTYSDDLTAGNEKAIRAAAADDQAIAVALELGGDPDGIETMANAALIAAAPEMLAALMLAARDLQLASDASGGAYGKTLDQMLAAIAKATREA